MRCTLTALESPQNNLKAKSAAGARLPNIPDSSVACGGIRADGGELHSAEVWLLRVDLKGDAQPAQEKVYLICLTS